MSWGLSSIKIKYVHMRCAAHILNLVVNEGLKEMSTSIKKVREVVRYIRSSPSRLMKFKDFYDFLGIQSRVSLCLDVPTRWNSTYLMLKSACIYEKTFVQYEETELSLRTDLGDNVPDFLDWQCAKNLVKFLHHFYEMTMKISGSQYVIANKIFFEFADLFMTLNEWKSADDLSLRSMGLNMKSKFDKY